jgi:hypothetical protein
MALLRRIGMISCALMVALAGTSCQQHRPSLFESSPRAVLATFGVENSRDPKLAISSSGMVSMLAVYRDGDKNRLGFSMSHDGGDHFMPMLPVSQPDATVSSHGENSPSLATIPTATYALWEQEDAHGQNNLVVGRSLNFGHSFDKPVQVNDNEKPSFHGFANLGVAPNGDVYAVWLDGRDTTAMPGTFSVYIARSTDKGATFSKNHAIATSVCPCCRPSIAFGPGGEVIVAWRKVFPEDVRDMVVAVSQDNGESFSSGVRVADDGWSLSGCPDSGPSMVVLGTRIYVSWLTEGREKKSRIQFSWSDDMGKSFHAPISASGDLLDPNHPKFSASEDGRLLLVFQARKNEDGSSWKNLAAYVVEVIGDRTGDIQELNNGGSTATYPALVAGTAGRVYVAWNKSEDKGSSVVVARGRL